MQSYWQKQVSTGPLFPDIEWTKPEQRSKAGKLAVIGGNKLGFVAVAESYQTALDMGAGQVRAVLPDALKSSVPVAVTDVVFLPTNPSGGFSKEGLGELEAVNHWADVRLLIGDTGKNSETAVLFERLLTLPGHLVVTRDAADLLRPAAKVLVDRPQTTLVLSFAQLQKLFQAVYYPKILSFSMQLTQLVEALHKFTITYPSTIVTFHNNQLLVAHDGQVSTTPWEEPMLIWRGTVATRASAYLLWSPGKPFEALTASLFS
jgi:NAD(P)H-hydrate repair Nnr-like enzyme with NAD(P)H-hydrate dehydratase domain